MCGSHLFVTLRGGLQKCRSVYLLLTAEGGCATCHWCSSAFCCWPLCRLGKRRRLRRRARSPDHLLSAPRLNNRARPERKLLRVPPHRMQRSRMTRRVRGTDCAGAPLGRFAEDACWRSAVWLATRIRTISAVLAEVSGRAPMEDLLGVR